MTPGDNFLAANQLAALARITPRAASKAMHKCHCDKTWRGYQLQVRCTRGRGGRSGVVYMVALSSLPPALQAKWRARHGEPVAPEEADTSAAVAARVGETETDWRRRFETIRPALSHAARSTERARAITTICDATGHPERTIRRWLAAYDKSGFAGLQRKPPANAGHPPKLISRR